MSLFKTFFSLVLVTLFFSSLNAHKCVHDEMEVTLKTTAEDHHHKFFINHAATNYQPIRIAFDYSNIAGASDNMQYYIKEILMPPVQTYFEAALKVIPRSAKLIVEQGFCGSWANIPYSATNYGYEGDIVIFVSAVHEPSASYLARSIPCGIDPRTSRPTIGVIIFNTAYITLDMKSVTLEGDFSTTLHEITHVLGFSKALYAKYVNPDTLKPLTGHIYNKTVNGVPTFVLNVAPLTERLRAHFNCPTLEGAYLENQGGSGSFGAHFERRIFFNEFMTANDIRDPRFSEFTLALLEGTGWYKPVYTMAEPMTYGKNAGCAFLDSPCVNNVTKKAAFKEFCSPLTSAGIFHTRRAFGICGMNNPRAGSSLVSEFDYWGNKTEVIDPFADNCPQIQVNAEFDCEDVDNQQSALLGSYEYYGIGAKAFMGNLATSNRYYLRTMGYCFKTQCVKGSFGDYQLKVFFGDKGSATCYSAGAIKPWGSYFNFNNDFGGELQCPDPNDFCTQILSEGYCKGMCYGNGICRQDGCRCYEGWGSYNCALRQMDDHSSRCDENSNFATSYGDRCVCNPSNITCQCALGRKTGAECLPKTDNVTTTTNPIPDNGNTNPNNNNNTNIVPVDYTMIVTGLFVTLVVVILLGVLCTKSMKKRLNPEQNNNNISYYQNQSFQSQL